MSLFKTDYLDSTVVFISHADAAQLISIYTHESSNTVLFLGLEVQNSQAKTHWEAWLTPMSLEFYSMVSNSIQTPDFEDILTSYDDFLPIFYSTQEPGAKESNFQTDFDDCYGGGRYCNPDPDGAEGNQTGKDALDEMLRQKCLYDLNTTDSDFKGKSINKFWVYASKFLSCLVDTMSRKLLYC